MSARTAAEHAAACRELLSGLAERLKQRGPEQLMTGDPELLGRVTVGPQCAGIAMPPFDNSQMDGYAVCSEDLAHATAESPITLRIGCTAAAGSPPIEHRPGTASPVMTGAAIPIGSDAVVPIEQALPPSFPDLVRVGEGESTGAVGFAAPVPLGEFVRRQGSDSAVGSTILDAGTRLTPARIGALAAAAITAVAVRARPRVLLCSTGDEIAVGPGTSGPGLPPGHIHDANTPMLAAALRGAGAEVRVLRTDDRPAAFGEALAAAATDIDLIVTTGGISAGAYEVVRSALTPLGVRFLSVAMQPGGPQGYGTVSFAAGSETVATAATAATAARHDTPVLCFPGNPVSALLSTELFLLPTLRELAGLPPDRPRETRILAHSTDSPAGKLQLRRGRIEADGRVSLSGPSPHLLAGLAAADVVAEIPLGVAHAPENTPVTVWSIND